VRLSDEAIVKVVEIANLAQLHFFLATCRYVPEFQGSEFGEMFSKKVGLVKVLVLFRQIGNS
jgi:hypothetical protein